MVDARACLEAVLFAAFVSCILLSGCVGQDSERSNGGMVGGAELDESQIMPILSGNSDFSDWRQDFINDHHTEPDLLLTKKERLSEERVSEMIEESPVGMKAVTQHILSDLPLETGNVFYVEMADRSVQHKGIIAIIDAKEKKVIGFFATLGIVV